MGSIFSNRARQQGIESSDIQDRIRRLEESADLNKDGLVTKEELKQYAAQELQLKDSEILMLRAEKARLEKDIANLYESKQGKLDKARQEAKKWKEAYDTLHLRHEAYLETMTKEKESNHSTKVISNKAIDRFVDQLLKDPNINIYMLPDSIERPLYANTLKILLSIIQKTLDNANLDLIGHAFKLQMEPTLETRLYDQEQ